MSKLRTRSIIFFSMFLSVIFFAIPSLAQDITQFEENPKFIRAPKADIALGYDLFGDNVNLYTGTLTFIQTDVSLPGNNSLPVRIGRSIKTGDNVQNQIGRAFGRWELDIPHLHGIFPSNVGWKGMDETYSRCTKFDTPPYALGVNGTSYWDPEEFWHGSYLYIPGVGDQILLKRTQDSVVPGNPENFPVVTSKFWVLSCLPTLKNAGSLVTSGEGFLAISPDGTKYYFDWLVRYSAQRLTRATEQPRNAPPSDEVLTPTAVTKPALQRSDVWILPTKIIDRFGNTVTYTYDPQKPKNLLRIDSGDGRSIVLTYKLEDNGSQEVVDTVSDGTRTWKYNYHGTSTTFNLDSVVLPDKSAWSFANFDGLLNALRYGSNGGCDDKPFVEKVDLIGSIIHPSGATGKFTLRPTYHGLSHVNRVCFNTALPPAPPRFFATEALINKIITGPGRLCCTNQVLISEEPAGLVA